MKKLYIIYTWQVSGWQEHSKLKAYSAKQARYIFARKVGMDFNNVIALGV